MQRDSKGRRLAYFAIGTMVLVVLLIILIVLRSSSGQSPATPTSTAPSSGPVNPVGGAGGTGTGSGDSNEGPPAGTSSKIRAGTYQGSYLRLKLPAQSRSFYASSTSAQEELSFRNRGVATSVVVQPFTPDQSIWDLVSWYQGQGKIRQIRYRGQLAFIMTTPFRDGTVGLTFICAIEGRVIYIITHSARSRAAQSRAIIAAIKRELKLTRRAPQVS